MLGFEETDLEVAFVELLAEAVELAVSLLGDGRDLCARRALELVDLRVESLDQCVPRLRCDSELLLKHVKEETVAVVLVKGTPDLSGLLADNFQLLDDLLSGHLNEFDADVAIFLETLVGIDLVLQLEVGFIKASEGLLIQVFDLLELGIKDLAHVFADDLSGLEEADVDVLVFLFLIFFLDQLHAHAVQFFQVAVVHRFV